MKEELFNNIIKIIKKERENQIKKWGDQKHHTDKWMCILGEEFGEACKAQLEYNYSEFMKEIVQCAAVCIAILEVISKEFPHFFRIML